MTLTAAGRNVGRRVLAHFAAFEAAVLERVTRADLRGFYKVLAALDAMPLPESRARRQAQP